MRDNFKELMKEGNYIEALGNNYSPEPYYILNFINGGGKEPVTIPGYFATRMQAEQKVHQLGLKTTYMIGNLNADWL